MIIIVIIIIMIILYGEQMSDIIKNLINLSGSKCTVIVDKRFENIKVNFI
jgi:hypothetical protein